MLALISPIYHRGMTAEESEARRGPVNRDEDDELVPHVSELDGELPGVPARS
jgi:hypothetical protein